MSEPGVEEIVAEFEKYGDLDQMRTTEVRSLIADWRKRGEALEEAAWQLRNEGLKYAAEDAESALTPPQPPTSAAS